MYHQLGRTILKVPISINYKILKKLCTNTSIPNNHFRFASLYFLIALPPSIADKLKPTQKTTFISQNFILLVPKINLISRGQNLELFTDQNEKTFFQG